MKQYKLKISSERFLQRIIDIITDLEGTWEYKGNCNLTIALPMDISISEVHF